jgi:hypothetical protein
LGFHRIEGDGDGVQRPVADAAVDLVDSDGAGAVELDWFRTDGLRPVAVEHVELRSFGVEMPVDDDISRPGRVRVGVGHHEDFDVVEDA